MKLYKTLAIAAVGAMAFGVSAQARDYVTVKGSSTVFPYANIVAENFHAAHPEFPAPVVESGGSSAGLKAFCQADGAIDVANASRLIKDKEVKACHEAGVNNIIEVRFGYDGIVFANPVDKPAFAFEPKDIYMALAAQVPMDGKLVDNPYKYWDEVNKAFPHQEITMYIPGEKHGTREVFETKVLEAGCKATDGYNLQLAAHGDDKKKAGKACYQVRKDGRSVDIDGDYTETLARVQSNPDAFGVFGLFFASQNPDKVKTATMSGIVATQESIASGEYPVSRPLQFYVKGEHLDTIPGLKEYVDYFMSEDMVGDFGKCVEAGLVPLPAAERTQVLDRIANRTSVGS